MRQDSRPGALQPTAGVLCGAGGDWRTAADAALSECGGGASGADEEQDERPADGGWGRVQQAAVTRKELLHGIVGQLGRGTGIGEGSAASEPRSAGAVRNHAEANPRPAAKGPRLVRRLEVLQS